MATKQQIENIISNIKEYIEEKHTDIQEYLNDMNKAMAKGELHKVKFANSMVADCFTIIEQNEKALEKWNHELEVVSQAEGGFEAVVEYAKEIFNKDVEWHREMKKKLDEKGSKHFKDMVKAKQMTASAYAIMMMTEQEAHNLFRKDLVVRIIKLKQQISKKVGNVVECDCDRNFNSGFDGVFVGELGTCRLTTIGAGGYNIQRYHFRTKITMLE